MEKSLQVLNILETPFLVDWDQKHLTEVANPSNVIPFSFDGQSYGKATLLIDKITKMAFQGSHRDSLLDPNAIEVHIRMPSEVDLKAAKFGYTANQGYDIDSARRVLQRIMGPFRQREQRQTTLKI
jgi:hypothetical protein